MNNSIEQLASMMERLPRYAYGESSLLWPSAMCEHKDGEYVSREHVLSVLRCLGSVREGGHILLLVPTDVAGNENIIVFRVEKEA